MGVKVVSDISTMEKRVKTKYKCNDNTTIAGVYAHLSALKGGETLKIPAVRA